MIHSTVISGSTVTATGGASTIIVNNVTGVWPVGITNDTDAFTSGGIVFSGSNLTFGTSVDGATQYIQATAGGAGIAIGDGASNVTDATVVFAGSNGIGFGISGSTMTASHNAYSVTSQFSSAVAARSHTHGNPSLQLSNLSGAVTSVSNGWTISLTGVAEGFSATSQLSSAFLAGYTESTHDFTQYAGILTTGVTGANATINSSQLLINVTGGAGGAALQGSGTYTQNSGTIQFVNSNDITFGLTSNQMTASFSQSTHAHDYVATANSSLLQHTSATSAITASAVNTNVTSQWLTTAALSNHTHSDLYINTSLSGGFQLTSDNSLSLAVGYTTHTHNYQSTGAYLTTAAVTDHTHSNLYIALGNSTAYATSVLSGTFQTTGAYLTTAAQSNHTHTGYITTAAISEHTHGSISIASTAGTDFTYSSASNGMSFSIPKWITTYAAGGGEIAVSAGAASADLASIVFSNSGGVSFGLNGSTITATVKTDYQSAGAYLTTAMASDGGSIYQLTANNSLSLDTAYTTHTHNYLTTALATNEPHIRELNVTNGSYSNATVNLRNHSNITLSADGATIKFSVADAIPLGNSTAYQTSVLSGTFQTTGAYLTTAMASNAGSLYQLTSDNSLSLGTGYTTHTHLYQSTGNYLTTAALSDHTHSNLYIALGNSTAYQTSVLSGTFQTTGAYLTTAAASNHTHDYQSTGAYLTTAMASNASSNFAGVNSSTQSTSGSALAITYNTSGLSLGIPAWVTTGGAGGGVAISASGSSVSGGTVVFSNSNGLSFGMNGSTVTMSVANNAGSLGFNDSNGVTFGIASTTSNSSTVVTASIAAYGGTSLSTVSTAGSVLLGGIGTAGLSLSVPAWLTTAATGGGGGGVWSVATTSAGTDIVISTATNTNTLYHPAFITTYAPGGDGVAWSLSTVSGTDLLLSTATNTNTLYYPAWITTYSPGGGAVNWSVSTITGTNILITTATNTMTLYQPAYITGYTESTHAFTQYVGLTSTAITGGSATIASNQLLINIPSNAGSLGFADSNGITFGVASTTSNSSTVVTASIAAYAGTSLSTVSTNGSVLLGAINTAGISMSVPAWLTAAAGGGGVAIAGSGASTVTSGTMQFGNANGISFGLDGSTMTASRANQIISRLEPIPYSPGVTRSSQFSSRSWVIWPILIPQDISVSYIRMLVTGGVAASTSLATASSTSLGFTRVEHWYAVLYTRGIGDSSNSIQAIYSNYVPFGHTWTLSHMSTNSGSEYTMGQTMSIPMRHGTLFTVISQNIQTTATNISISQSWSSALTGDKYFDIPFETSLSAGNYWIGFNKSVSTAIAGSQASRFGSVVLNGSMVLMSGANVVRAMYGVATHASNNSDLHGGGVWTTNVQGTTASIALSEVSSHGSHNAPYFIMNRYAN